MQPVDRRKGRQESVHHFRVPVLQGLDDMSQDKTVDIEHDRQGDLGIFGHAKGEKYMVEDFLPVLGENLNPA